jgi:hypothetical protein
MRCADLAMPAGIDEVAGLFADAHDDLFASLPWYRTVLGSGMRGSKAARFLRCGSSVFPMQITSNGRNFANLTTLYTCRWQPIAGPVDAFSAFARACRAWPITRLDALPEEWPQRSICSDAACDAGLAVRRFDHFGNWYEDTRGQSWETYLAARPSQLREAIRRKLRGNYSFELITGGERLEAGVDAFETVYGRSWKDVPMEPHFL